MHPTHSSVLCIQQWEKCRVIDDANDGGQSALSSDANKLDLCTAIQPGIHVRLLATALREQYAPWDARFDPFETGGEDLPNAYRHVPMVPEDSWASIVTYWDPSRAAPCFLRYFGLLFGLPNAVCSFNRFPRMLQCFFRRLGFCMASMYFDDLTVQDLQKTKVPANSSVSTLHPYLDQHFLRRSTSLCKPLPTFLAFVTMWEIVTPSKASLSGFEIGF